MEQPTHPFFGALDFYGRFARGIADQERRKAQAAKNDQILGQTFANQGQLGGLFGMQGLSEEQNLRREMAVGLLGLQQSDQAFAGLAPYTDQKFGQARQELGGVFGAEHRRVEDSRRRLASSLTQDLGRKGLGSTTVLGSLQAGLGESALRAHQDVGSRESAARTGLTQAEAQAGLRSRLANAQYQFGRADFLTQLASIPSDYAIYKSNIAAAERAASERAKGETLGGILGLAGSLGVAGILA